MVSRKRCTYTGVEDLLLQATRCPCPRCPRAFNTTVWSCSDALQRDSNSITIDLQDIKLHSPELYELFTRDPSVAMPLVSSNSPNLHLPIWTLDLRNTL